MQDSHAADVQAELQQYLNSKNINSLFISIVEVCELVFVLIHFRIH